MNRGDVYLSPVQLPNRAGEGLVEIQKYVVALQGGPDFDHDAEVAVVVASTLRRDPPHRPFEVVVGVGEGFAHDTVIDCRWPLTLRKAILIQGEYLTTLGADRMFEVSQALYHGLQMRRA